MSLSNSMAEVGRPVAYYPRLAKFLGSVNAAILFSQLFYWQGRTVSEIGVFKTAEEWTEETGLSYREQATARKHLVELGLLIETHKRLEHRIYFKLDFAAADDAFGEWTKAHPANCAKRIPPNDENAFRELRETHLVNSTETTSETTSEKGVSRKRDFLDKPAGVDDQTWQDFLALRKAHKAPLTATALLGLEREANAAGYTLQNALATCCARGWRGFKADWVSRDAIQRGGLPMTKTEAVRASLDKTEQQLIESGWMK